MPVAPDNVLMTVANPAWVRSGSFNCQELVLIYGLMGGGKSYMALKHFIWPELVRGKRTIVTNHKLNLGRVRELLQKRVGTDGSDASTRIRLLDDKAMCEFYLHRGLKDGSWWDCESGDIERLPVGEDGKKGRGEQGILSYALDHPRGRPDGGVMYVFDEAHFGLRARDWQAFGRTAEWYFNHIRKPGDSVILCTPHPKQLDVYVRNILQTIYHVRNSFKEKFKFLFRGPRAFVYSEYLGPYDGSMERVGMGVMTMDKELADCYDTASGAGIVGGGTADKNVKRRGLPFWFAPAAVLALVAALLLGPRYLAGGLMRWFVPSIRNAAASQVSAVMPSVPLLGRSGVNGTFPAPSRVLSEGTSLTPPAAGFLVPLEDGGPFNGLFATADNDVVISLWNGRLIHGTMLDKYGYAVRGDDGKRYYSMAPPEVLVGGNTNGASSVNPSRQSDVGVDHLNSATNLISSGTGGRPPVKWFNSNGRERG